MDMMQCIDQARMAAAEADHQAFGCWNPDRQVVLQLIRSLSLPIEIKRTAGVFKISVTGYGTAQFHLRKQGEGFCYPDHLPACLIEAGAACGGYKPVWHRRREHCSVL